MWIAQDPLLKARLCTHLTCVRLTSNELEEVTHMTTRPLVFVPMWVRVGILHIAVTDSIVI